MRLLEFFPTEPDLAALGAASYMGTELRRLRAEAARRSSHLLLDTATDAILVLDAEFKITRLNPRAMELFNCTDRLSSRHK
jgi:PAS domain-containing protein